MSAPVKINLKIYQGSTFNEVLRWESSTLGYTPITGITKAAPTIITAVAHGIPQGWRALITNVAGMKEINDSVNYVNISSTTTDTVTLNEVNSLAYTAYTSGGVLMYNVPNNLAGVTARMQIRGKISDLTFIDELTTANGKIVIDNTLKTITLLLTDTVTSAYTFSNAVYSIELLVNGEVIPFIYGNVSLINEITR